MAATVSFSLCAPPLTWQTCHGKILGLAAPKQLTPQTLIISRFQSGRRSQKQDRNQGSWHAHHMAVMPWARWQIIKATVHREQARHCFLEGVGWVSSKGGLGGDHGFNRGNQSNLSSMVSNREHCEKKDLLPLGLFSKMPQGCHAPTRHKASNAGKPRVATPKDPGYRIGCQVSPLLPASTIMRLR